MTPFASVAVIWSLALASADPSSASAKPTSNWRSNIRVDAILDREEGSVSIIGADGRTRFHVACNGRTDKTLSLQFFPDGYLGSQPRNVIVRVDGGPPISTYSWLYVGDGAYTVNETLIATILGQITDGTNKIVVRAYDFENQPHDGVFTSVGGRSEIAKIQKICAPEASKP